MDIQGAGGRLIRRYHDLFVAQFTVKPAINGGKDGAILRRLAGQYGEAKVEELLALFLQDGDRFSARTGYTVGVFHGSLNRLLLAQVAQADRRKNTNAGYRTEGPITATRMRWPGTPAGSEAR